MINYIKTTSKIIILMLVAAVIFLYFGVYHMHSSSFKKLWPSTQVAFLVAVVISNVISAILWYFKAKEKSVIVARELNKTLGYIYYFRMSQIAFALTVSAWNILATATILPYTRPMVIGGGMVPLKAAGVITVIGAISLARMKYLEKI